MVLSEHPLMNGTSPIFTCCWRRDRREMRKLQIIWWWEFCWFSSVVLASSVLLVHMCLHGAGRKNVGEEKLKPFFFLLEFFIMDCLNLPREVSFGIKSGHQAIWTAKAIEQAVLPMGFSQQPSHVGDHWQAKKPEEELQWATGLRISRFLKSS